MQKFSQGNVSNAVHIILVVVVAYFLTVTDELHAQINLFTEDVIQKWKEFEHFSQTIQGTKRVTLTSSSFLQNKPLSYSNSYKQNRECALFSSSGTNAKGVVPTKRWTLVNSRYAATIKTDNSDPDKVALLNYEPNSVMEPSGSGFSVFDYIFFEVAPHFSYEHTRLSQLVTKDSFKVKKISKTSRDGYDLMQVDFNFDDKKQGIQSSGSLYLDPNHCWCIRRISESSVKMLNGKPFFKYQKDVDYQIVDHPSGFPLIKSMNLQSHGYSGKEKNGATYKAEYEWEINDHVPNSEFTLTTFGLPEPVGVTWEKPTPWYLWFLAAAGVCFVLAIFFRYLSRRWRLRAV